MAKFNFSITTVLTRGRYWLMYLLREILVIAELFIFLRLLLRFLLAAPQSFVVALIYEVTDNILFPFRGIFQDITVIGRPLDIIAISGMIGYVLVYFILARILSLLVRSHHGMVK
jgi:hypothetical protein